MAKLAIKKGSVDVSLYVFIQDSSSSTGAGLTGLVFNSASLTAYYVRPLGSATAITLATQTVTGAHSDGGFVEVSSTNMPGVYRLDLPDAVVASGVNAVVVMLKGATNMAALPLEIELVAYDPQDATALGLSRLDAAVTTRASQTSLDTLDDFVDTEVAAIKTKTDQLTFTTANKLDATIQAAGDFAQAAADKVWSTTTRTLSAFGFSVTVGTNNDKTGYGLSSAAVQSIWDALTSALTTASSIGKLLVDNVNATISSRASQTSVDTVDDFLDTEIAAIKTKTDQLTFTTANKVDSTIQVAGDFAQAAADKVWGTTTRALTDKSGFSLSSGGVDAVADQVWDEAISGHLSAGSTGEKLNAAGSAGDPWGTALPGAYGAGTAGNIIGNRVDLAISTRLAAASYTAPPTAAANADAVWDEARTDHTSAGTFGQGAASVQGNVTGSVGSVTGAVGSVTGAVGSVSGAVGSVTGNVGGNVVGSVASVTGAVGSVTGAVGSVTAAVTVGTNNDKTGYALSSASITAIWNEVLEAALTARHFMRIMLSSAALKLAGAATTTVTTRDVGDTKNRISATVDASGNRTAVTLDGT